jgi:hypothetical protein
MGSGVMKHGLDDGVIYFEESEKRHKKSDPDTNTGMCFVSSLILVELPRKLLAKGMDKGYELVELEELYIRNIENWEKKSLQGPFYCERGSCQNMKHFISRKVGILRSIVLSMQLK